MSLRSLALTFSVIAAAFTLVSDAYASGTKTITNNSADTIVVAITPRGAGKPVAKSIKPGKSVSITYGTDSNPYMNALTVKTTTPSEQVTANFLTTATGGPGTLDNLFNAYSYLVITSNLFGVSIASHN